MSQRLTFDEVKSRFEDKGFVLISKEYKNSKEKLEYMCTCGNLAKVELGALKNLKSCRKCSFEKASKQKSLKYKDVKKYFEDRDCELLENEYVNSSTLMKYICVCGNVHKIRFNAFKRGSRCPLCGIKKSSSKTREDFNYVKSYYKQQGCELLEKSYKNNSTDMKYKCICGNTSKTTFGNFKRGVRCINCRMKVVKQKLSFDIEYVRLFFKENDCDLLEDEYINANTPMRFKCSCGNIAHINLANFKNGKRCKSCGYVKIGSSLRLDYMDVKKYFEDQGCTLLSDEYLGNGKPLLYKCVCGNVSTTRFSGFKMGNRCKECFIERNSKENHHIYNPNISDEEREKGRMILGGALVKWRNSVYKRDNYTCVSCGSYGGKLRAHHIDGYHWCKEKRTNVNNGATLCEKCHDAKYEGSFHNIYGNRNNTRQQFEEWLKNKKNKNDAS